MLHQIIQQTWSSIHFSWFFRTSFTFNVQMIGLVRDRAWSIMNLAFFVTLSQRLSIWEMCLKIGPAPLVGAFLQPWLWIMTFSCWKWKHCREIVLSASAAGLALRQPARQACGGKLLPASQLSLYNLTWHFITIWKPLHLYCCTDRALSGIWAATINMGGYSVQSCLLGKSKPLLLPLRTGYLLSVFNECLNLLFSSHIIIDISNMVRDVSGVDPSCE